MAVVQVPWTSRSWALPFFSVLATTPKVSKKLGNPHKTIGEIAQQMIITVRRWCPDATVVPMKLIGDTAYSILELGLCCTRHNVTLVAPFPLRLDSRLYEPYVPPVPAVPAPDITGGKMVGKVKGKGQKGRPRVKGVALPKMSAVLDDPHTQWVPMKVRWYDGRDRVRGR